MAGGSELAACIPRTYPGQHAERQARLSLALLHLHFALMGEVQLIPAHEYERSLMWPITHVILGHWHGHLFISRLRSALAPEPDGWWLSRSTIMLICASLSPSFVASVDFKEAEMHRAQFLRLLLVNLIVIYLHPSCALALPVAAPSSACR